MISAALVAMLRCPVTRQTLAVAPKDLIDRLNAERVMGELRDRSGKPVAGPIEEGLVRADGALFFPVRGGIPIFLMDEAIELPAIAGAK